MKARYLILSCITAVAAFAVAQANAHLAQDSFYQYYQNGDIVGYQFQACSGARQSGGIVTTQFDVSHTPCGDIGDWYDFYCDDSSMTCYYD